MPAAPEKEFRQEVMAMLRSWHAHVTNHEDSWQPGIADLSWAYSGRDGWIELKSVAISGDRVKIGFTHEQSKWLRDRQRAGNGRVVGLVEVRTPHLEYWVYQPLDIRALTDTVTVEFARSKARLYRTLEITLRDITQ